MTRTNKEQECLIVNGYAYRKGKVVAAGTTQNWRCVKRRCNGTAKTKIGSMEGLTLLNSHVCLQSPNAFAVDNLFEL